MHGGNHRDHHHDHDHHHHDHDHEPGPGHNHAARPRQMAQWQTPHLPEAAGGARAQAGEPDLDLVENAFLEGFTAASDPTSFLRLAQVPFEAMAPDGKRLVLLRVETETVTDVGAVTPHLGGASFRYDVLPGRMASCRARLWLVYFDGKGVRPLRLAEARNLAKP